MSFLAVVPSWVVPISTAVRDCHLIAHRAFQESGSDRLGGIYAAANWVTGGQRAPVTEREDCPVSEALARGEMWAADSVSRTVLLPPQIWASLGVEPRAPLTENREWSQGVARALGWLVGVHDRPPLLLPRRPVPTAEELYQEALAAKPHGFWLPEDHQRARVQAEKAAAQSRALAAYADGAA
jgi:hypothetical protein